MTAMRIPHPNEADDAVFLSALFATKPTDQHVLIWTLPNKISRTFTDAEAALECVRQQQDDCDVYIGVGMSGDPLTQKRRYTAGQITAIWGVWADIDFLDENHKKSNLPETEDEALALAYSTGLTPTMVVHSGHGLHCWWLFHKPLLIDDDNRADVQAFVWRWIDSVRRRARIKGWTIDATQDLARVLRVPGTTNYKDPKNPLPVRLREFNDVRYDGPEDFEESIENAPIDIFASQNTVQKNINDMALPDDIRKLARTLVISANAQPPFAKWNELISQNPQAKRTFDHKRRELDSLSDYDFSLALFAMQADEEWTNQEITDLLIAHRAKYAKSTKDLKLRPDYYARTLLRARAKLNTDDATQELHDLLNGVAPSEEPHATPSDGGSTRPKQISAAAWAAAFGRDDDTPLAQRKPKPSADEEASDDEEELDAEDKLSTASQASISSHSLTDEERRQKTLAAYYGEGTTPERMLRTLNNVFDHRFDVLRVIRMVSSPPMFGIVIRMKHTGETLNIHLGDISGIMTQRTFCQTMAAYASIVIPMRKAKDWEGIVSTLLAVAENEAIGEEATETGMITSWLNSFIERYMIANDWSGEDGEGAPPSIGAFSYNGLVCFSGNGLLYWLRTDSMERVSPQNLGKMLRAISAKNISVPYRKNGVRTTRSVWALSEEMSQHYSSMSLKSDTDEGSDDSRQE